MPMGPFIIFDKSQLQALSVDQAVIMDQLFLSVLTPLFLFETLADLEKVPPSGHSPESVVGLLSAKTPVCHSYVSAPHWKAILADLRGNEVEMSGRPHVEGAIPVRTDDKDGLVFRRSPEAEALDRWQRGQFEDAERSYAVQWRQMIAALDLAAVSDAFKAHVRKEDRPKTLERARAMAAEWVRPRGDRYRLLLTALRLLGIHREHHPDIISAWKAAGGPPLSSYAPFATHCLEVDIFFYLAMSANLISDQRATHKIDLSYLYYLPFTQVFTSVDRLHKQCVPLFLRPDQSFIHADDLKKDLASLNEHFAGLPEEIRRQGLFRFASKPPVDSSGVVAALWDKHRAGWRQRRELTPTPSPALERVLAQSNAMSAAATVSRAQRSFPDDPQQIRIERAIPMKRGSWQMFSEDMKPDR